MHLYTFNIFALEVVVVAVVVATVLPVLLAVSINTYFYKNNDKFLAKLLHFACFAHSRQMTTYGNVKKEIVYFEHRMHTGKREQPKRLQHFSQSKC